MGILQLAGIAIALVIMLMLIPFISIMMLIKLNRERKINKGIKKGIRSGAWLNDYKYIMSEKFQKKIDKMHWKQEKKLLKQQKKFFNDEEFIKDAIKYSDEIENIK